MPTYTLSITIEEANGNKRRFEVMSPDTGGLDEFFNDIVHKDEEKPIVRVFDAARLDALLHAEPETKVRGPGRPVSYRRLSTRAWAPIERLVLMVKPDLLDAVKEDEEEKP